MTDGDRSAIQAPTCLLCTDAAVAHGRRSRRSSSWPAAPCGCAEWPIRPRFGEVGRCGGSCESRADRMNRGRDDDLLGSASTPSSNILGYARACGSCAAWTRTIPWSRAVARGVALV